MLIVMESPAGRHTVSLYNRDSLQHHVESSHWTIHGNQRFPPIQRCKINSDWPVYIQYCSRYRHIHACVYREIQSKYRLPMYYCWLSVFFFIIIIQHEISFSDSTNLFCIILHSQTLPCPHTSGKKRSMTVNSPPQAWRSCKVWLCETTYFGFDLIRHYFTSYDFSSVTTHIIVVTRYLEEPWNAWRGRYQILLLSPSKLHNCSKRPTQNFAIICKRPFIKKWYKT